MRQQEVHRPGTCLGAPAHQVEDQGASVAVRQPGAECLDPGTDHGQEDRLSREPLERETAQGKAQLAQTLLPQPLLGNLFELLGRVLRPHRVETADAQAALGGLVDHRPQIGAPVAREAELAQIEQRLLGHLQRAQPEAMVDREARFGGFVDARDPTVGDAVVEVLARGALELFLGRERVAAGQRDRAARRVRNQPLASHHEQVVLVFLDGEGRERVAAVEPEDPLDLGAGRLLAAAKNDGPQDEHQDVEPGEPAGDLDRAEEARGILGPGLERRLPDQDPRNQRLARRPGARLPPELVLELAQSDVAVEEDGQLQHRSHPEAAAH